jgi:hypothetical protein
MNLYGHLIDRNLWDAAARLGDISGPRDPSDDDEDGAAGTASGS